VREYLGSPPLPSPRAQALRRQPQLLDAFDDPGDVAASAAAGGGQGAVQAAAAAYAEAELAALRVALLQVTRLRFV